MSLKMRAKWWDYRLLYSTTDHICYSLNMKLFGNKKPSIPDVPLKNMEILNPVTEAAMNNLFVDGSEQYPLFYRAFLATASNDIELLREADKYDAITPKGWDMPSSFATLEQAHNLQGELGVLVRNAITFAVAITSGPDISGGDLVGLAYRWERTKPKKSFDEYRTEMYERHPKAAAIAEAVASKHSKRLARDVVACMGYLIDASDEMAKGAE